jgi:hypothetical protein
MCVCLLLRLASSRARAVFIWINSKESRLPTSHFPLPHLTTIRDSFFRLPFSLHSFSFSFSFPVSSFSSLAVCVYVCMCVCVCVCVCLCIWRVPCFLLFLFFSFPLSTALNVRCDWQRRRMCCICCICRICCI